MPSFLKRLALLLILSALPLAYAGQLVGTLTTANGIPVKNGILSFTPTQVGFIAGTGVQVPSAVTCATSTDGSIVGLANPLTFPALTKNQSVGTLPAGTYYVVFALYSSTGTTLTSPESQITLSAPGTLIFTPPTLPSSAIGWRVYIGTATGAETLQGSLTAGQFQQSTSLIAGTALPVTNTTSCTLNFNDTIIPTGTGYNVSLHTPTGQSYPGFPMVWQLTGGTVNVSSGLPTYTGTVIYPSPILASPLNHGSQSISGPLDLGGYNLSNVGAVNAQSLAVNSPLNIGGVNSVLNASLQSGTDIGAQVNNAFAACVNACTVYVPAGTYSYATTIALPTVAAGTAALQIDSGAVLTYTGSGWAITATSAGGSLTNLRLFGGGAIYGTASALGGLQITNSNGIIVDHITIRAFTAGDGIQNNGSNGVDLIGDVLGGNKNNLHETGSVSFAPTTKMYGGQIIGAVNWGLLSDYPGGGTSSTAGSAFYGVNFVGNGSSGATGTVDLKSNVEGPYLFSGNYFETTGGSTNTYQIVINDPAGSLTVHDVTLSNNLFASAGTHTASIYDNGANTTIQQNEEVGTPTEFVFGGPAGIGRVLDHNDTAFTSLFAGADNGATTISRAGTFSSLLNSYGPTPNGMGFVQLTGLSADLITKCRVGGTNVMVFDNSGGSLIGLTDCSGNTNFAGNLRWGGGQTIASADKVLRNVGTITTTVSASDSLSVAMLTSAGVCVAYPQNATAAGLTGVYAVPGTGSVVLNHSSTAGGVFQIACSLQ